jgi:hypothetical protein
MHVGLLQVDLPEPRYFLPDEFLAPEDLKNMLARHFLLEGDLRAGKQAYCYGWLFDRCETTSDRVFKPRRH